MDLKDSSEDEDVQHISAFSKFDESIEVRNAEEIKSPVNTAKQREEATSALKKSPKNSNRNESPNTKIGIPSGPTDPSHLSRYPTRHKNQVTSTLFGNSSGIKNVASDSEETDDDEIQGGTARVLETYNPKEFEDLYVSAEIKELFENIIRFSPQKIELDYKLIPFVPDYIPAVGDIDAFIKIPTPDGSTEEVGLIVLDEPCANQSDPAVLHLQLRSQSKSAGPMKQALIKKIEDSEKNPKAIEKWISDMTELHRSRHLLLVQLSKPTIDIDTLMQQWPTEVDERLQSTVVDLSQLNCNLSSLIDIACTFIDVPVYSDAKLEALHTMFTLFLEIRNHQYQV